MRLTLLVPFGLKGDKLYEPTQVDNGKACGCICPACKKPLVAKQNAKTPHFAHAYDENCAKGVETAVHLAVKQFIAEKMKVRLPALIWTTPVPGKTESKTLYSERIVALESVALEQVVDDFKPDIVVIGSGTKFFIEVAVTHFVDEEKQQKINKRKISTFEIDVSKLKHAFTMEALEKALFDSSNYQAEWKYHPNLEQLDLKARREEAQRVAELKKAVEARRRKFDIYRNLLPKQKLEINLRSAGLTIPQMQVLSVFVPWANSYGVPRIVWQSAVLAYLAKVQEEKGFDEYLPSCIYIEDCLDWLEDVFVLTPQVPDGGRIALRKYFQYLENIGMVRKTAYKDYELKLPKRRWPELTVR